MSDTPTKPRNPRLKDVAEEILGKPVKRSAKKSLGNKVLGSTAQKMTQVRFNRDSGVIGVIRDPFMSTMPQDEAPSGQSVVLDLDLDDDALNMPGSGNLQTDLLGKAIEPPPLPIQPPPLPKEAEAQDSIAWQIEEEEIVIPLQASVPDFGGALRVPKTMPGEVVHARPEPADPPPLPSFHEQPDPPLPGFMYPTNEPDAPEAAAKISQAPLRKTMMMSRKPTLPEILLDRGLLSEEAIAQVEKERKGRGKQLGFVPALQKLGLIKQEIYGRLVIAVLENLGEASGLDDFHDLADLEVLDSMRVAKREKDRVFPLRIRETKRGRVLDALIGDPNNLMLMDELRAVYNVARVLPVAPWNQNAIDNYGNEMSRQRAKELGGETGTDTSITVLKAPGEEDVDAEAAARGKSDKYITRIVDKIIYDGVRLGASDIHVEYGELPRVRYRVDGLLQEGGWIGREDYPAVVSRFKILSQMDISERRLPQDGNIRLGVEGRGVLDFRVNTIPSSGGEKVCLRILDGSKLRDLGIHQVGLPEDILENYLDKVDKPQGMILITGPTGSGKSTTLYSSLYYVLDTKGKETNIVTAEDPIEYRVEGLNQTQLNEKAKLSFPVILKSFLRQDPDVILVGEIRDLETAELAMKASQTGHMVLSTLHTNTAIATVARLVNMGIEPFMVADVLLCVMNQRLARRICSHCKTEQVEIDPRHLAMLPAHERDKHPFYMGAGCSHCSQRGYKGRVGFYEYLNINPAMKRMINSRATEEEMLYQARDDGFLTLREYGLLKAQEGISTLEEVYNHTIDPFGGE